MAANRIQLQNGLHKSYDRVLFSREVLSPVFGSGFTLNSSLVSAAVSPNKSESAAIDKVWIYGNILLDDSTEITCYEVLLQPIKKHLSKFESVMTSVNAPFGLHRSRNESIFQGEKILSIRMTTE